MYFVLDLVYCAVNQSQLDTLRKAVPWCNSMLQKFGNGWLYVCIHDENTTMKISRFFGYQRRGFEKKMASLHINLRELFNAKSISGEEQQWYYLTHSCEDKVGGVHIFLVGFCLKVNIIVRLEFELAYFEVAGEHFSYYATRTQPDPGWVGWV